MSEFIFKNARPNFRGELSKPSTNTVVIFKSRDTIIQRRKGTSFCNRVGDFIDIPKYSNDLFCILEAHNSRILSFLSLRYKKKNKLTLFLFSNPASINIICPISYQENKISEYSIYDSTEKIYSDCMNALILVKK